MEKFFFALGSHLAHRGHTVTHISCAHAQLPQRQTLDGVQHLRVASAPMSANPFLNKWRDWQFSCRAYRALPEADVLITNSFFLPLLCRTPRTHGALFPYIGRTPRGQLPLYAHAAGLFVPSSAVLHSARQQSPTLATKLHLLPLALPHWPNDVSPKAPHTGAFRLLYAGRIHPEKGLHLLLRALALLPSSLQAQLSLRVAGAWQATAGGGGAGYFRQLQQLAAATRTPVHFLGPLFNPTDLAREYARADLFVYPSLAQQGETFGVAPLEALSHGTPILTSQLDCFGDFLRTQNTPNGFTFHHRAADPARALAHALIQAYRQRLQWPAFSANARQVAQHFTLEATAQNLINFLESTLPHAR